MLSGEIVQHKKVRHFKLGYRSYVVIQPNQQAEASRAVRSTEKKLYAGGLNVSLPMLCDKMYDADVFLSIKNVL